MLTHENKTNDKNNIPLSLNPNIFDDKPAFLSARVVTRSKSIFSKKKQSIYNYHQEMNCWLQTF